MIERTPDKATEKTGLPQAAPEELGYRIELWDAYHPDAVERVLARAFSATLAQAIYKAAQTEHPDRRITLSQGDKRIADTAGGHDFR
jgi:hypothetical protein